MQIMKNVMMIGYQKRCSLLSVVVEITFPDSFCYVCFFFSNIRVFLLFGAGPRLPSLLTLRPVASR